MCEIREKLNTLKSNGNGFTNKEMLLFTMDSIKDIKTEIKTIHTKLGDVMQKEECKEIRSNKKGFTSQVVTWMISISAIIIALFASIGGLK